MVSNAEYYRSDPQPGKDRGAGWYYYRGALKKGNRRVRTWSKYTPELDAEKKSPRTRVEKVDYAEKYKPHKGDYKTTRSNRKTSRLEGRGPKGYF